MKDEEKSGLQISQGDFVSFLPVCCALGIPEFFWGSSIDLMMLCLVGIVFRRTSYC
jgi:hypothetical protein